MILLISIFNQERKKFYGDDKLSHIIIRRHAIPLSNKMMHMNNYYHLNLTLNLT